MATRDGPALHAYTWSARGGQLGNGRVVAIGGLIVAIIGTVATVVGVWLQFRQPQPQPPEPITTVTETTTTSEPDTLIDETTTESPETEATPTSEAEITESAGPLFTTSTLQEAFGLPENGDCRDANSAGYAEDDVAVQYCTFSNSPVYFLLHKYAGVNAADYLAHYSNSEYRSGLDGPDGQLCAERYLKTFTGDDGVVYNSKIVQFLSTPFLAEINAPAQQYSRADIEKISVQINPDVTC